MYAITVLQSHFHDSLCTEMCFKDVFDDDFTGVKAFILTAFAQLNFEK
jgi:hypothetical protein